MVAIVSGNSLGLNLTFLSTLGQKGIAGSAGVPSVLRTPEYLVLPEHFF